jgi:hypothetical protein
MGTVRFLFITYNSFFLLQVLCMIHDVIMPFASYKTSDERFWEKVQKTDTCWIWVGAKLPTGYGRFWEGDRCINAHWYLLNPRPVGKQVACHTCDNPSCVRPDHIFVGTYSDNMRDCVDKGRHVKVAHKGEANANAKLTDHQALVIRACPDVFGAKTALAKHFGVHVGIVGGVVRGTGWSHLGEPTESHRQEALSILGSTDGTLATVPGRELTEEQAMLAKACPHVYGSASSLARAFGVSIGCIHNIRIGKTWKHLPEVTDEDVQRASALISSTPAVPFGRPKSK